MNAPSVEPPADAEQWAARMMAYWETPMGKAEIRYTTARTKSERATLAACKAWADVSTAATAFLRAGQANPAGQAERETLAEWHRHHEATRRHEG